MKSLKSFLMFVVLAHAGLAACQEGRRWSLERNILPSNIEAREAKLVILSDGSLNVTFRGSEIESPEIGGVFFTRSTDQGYSWSKPQPAVSVPGIQNVTHEIQSEGDSLLLYVTVFRPPSFEVLQFLSLDRGRTWRETERVFSDTDPVRVILTWKLAGKMHVAVLTERPRSGSPSEFTFWLARGRASGTYWDPPTKIKTIFASSLSIPRLVESVEGTSPSIYWRQDGYQDWVLDVILENPLTWRSRPVGTPPPLHKDLEEDRGVYYKVTTTQNRRVLFNRTDENPPTTELLAPIPSSIDKPSLNVVWQGKDNYTLPSSLSYEIQLDEQPAKTISDATQFQFESLVNGAHRLSLVAIDEAGNRQVPPTAERFTVRVLPVPKFIHPRNGDLLNVGTLNAAWQGEHNCEPDSVLVYSLKLDDRDWGEYGPAESQVIEGLEDGEHALFLRARDALDNISEDGVDVRFEVDQTPPQCVAEETSREWQDLPWPDLPDFSVQFRVVGSDNRTPGDDLEYNYQLDDGEPYPWRPITESTLISGLQDGIHRVSFRARDEAGNTQLEASVVAFDFNTPPNTRVWLDETRLTPTYRFAGKDSNNRPNDLSYRWRVDESSWSDWTTLSEIEASKIREGVSHGEHRLLVQARDPGGNVDPSPAELIIDVDTLPPPVPAGLVAVSREDGAIVEISWGSVAEPNVRYNVYRSTEETFRRDSAVLIAAELQRTRTSDNPKRQKNTLTYTYFVTALDRSGNESEASESQSVQVLGETEQREKEFEEKATKVDDLVRAGRWEEVAREMKDLGEPPPGKEAYPSYWGAVAKAGISLSEEPPSLGNLVAARAAMADFLEKYPDFSQAAEAERLFAEVKTKILWNRLKTYGIYGGVFVVVLILVLIVYRWIQNRRITEMPKITITEGAEEITPSKEALKDPTVLRRWAEVQADPESAENWGRLAFAFHNIGELESAVQSLYKALEISPENTRFHFQMGHFQKEAENIRESIRHFERYLQLNPESKKSAEEVQELLVKLKGQLKG